MLLSIFSDFTVGDILGILGLVGTLGGAYVYQEKRIASMSAEVKELRKDFDNLFQGNEAMEKVVNILERHMAEMRGEFRTHISNIIETQRRHEHMLQSFTDSIRDFFEKYDLKKKE